MLDKIPSELGFLFSFFYFRRFNGYYSGMGKTTFVMFQGIIGAFCIRIPVSYFVSKISGATLFHIGLASPASTILQITMCGVFLYICIKKEKS